MRAIKKLTILAVAGLLPLTAAPAVSAETPQYPHIVDQAFVAEYAVIPKRDDVVIIDSRPTVRKYDIGHLPGAVSIPDRTFDKLTHMLPEDRSTLLIFYCGGYSCKLSPNSAAKALGYTKVQVFQAGFPAWKAAYGPGETATTAKSMAPKIVVGPESDTITVDSFERILREAPDSILMIDVRGPEEVARGSFKTATFMTVDEVEENVDTIPTEKPIVFVCSTGTRSAEAYDILKMAREDVKAYFLDAQVTFNGDGTQTIVANTE